MAENLVQTVKTENFETHAKQQNKRAHARAELGIVHLKIFRFNGLY